MLLTEIEPIRNRGFLIVALSIFFIGVINPAGAQNFIHPGLLHGREDIERMKNAVTNKEEPIYSGYQVFIQNPASQPGYRMQGPMDTVGRNPTIGQATYDNDANAAHQNAIMWCITGDKQYARKSIEIINAWSFTLKAITGRDAVLMAGLGPFKMVNAAELIRYSNAGWADADIRKTEKHFKEIIYPVLKNFAPFANGNWDAAAIKTVMAMGVFCNDKDMYEMALRYYVNGHGNGRLTHYIINEAGQIQESGRDQGHTQLGIGMLAECCEIAWHQGLDLYGYADNRLLKGFEYVAKFNLGNEVPFTETLDRTGKYHHTVISNQDRGKLRAVYEQVYNHYVNRLGIVAPYTQQAAEKLRPEGPGRPGADHPGYGTLYFTRQAQSTTLLNRIPVAPAGIILTGTSKEINIRWVGAIGATGYTIKRARKAGGPYAIIAKNITATSFKDQQIKQGTIYNYTISASNTNGESSNAHQAAICAGLPHPWKQQDIGSIPVNGSTAFDGAIFTLKALGRSIGPTKDDFHFTCFPLNGDGEIIARFVPQPGSQFSTMGLMMRENLMEDAAHVSLLIYPGKTGQVEAPNWHVRLISRKATGDETVINNIGSALPEPAVTWGRLTGHCWLRLQRQGNNFTGSTSLDGKTWTAIGAVTGSFKKNLLTGLSVLSGIKTVATTVMFDSVEMR